MKNLIRIIKTGPKGILLATTFFDLTVVFAMLLILRPYAGVDFLPIKIMAIGVIFFTGMTFFKYPLLLQKNWPKWAAFIFSFFLFVISLKLISPAFSPLGYGYYRETFSSLPKESVFLVFNILNLLLLTLFARPKISFSTHDEKKEIAPHILHNEEIRPASRIKRFFAFFIDIFFPFLLILVQLSSAIFLLNVVPLHGYSRSFNIWTILYFSQLALVPLVLFIFIVSFILVLRRSQSIGKFLLNIQVVNHKTDKRIGFFRYIFIREIFGKSLLIGFMPFLGYFQEKAGLMLAVYIFIDSLFIFRSDRRTLHDFIGGTRVIDLSGFQKRKSLFDFSKL